MLILYNTLSRQLEPFKPAGEEVTIYVCGITPYDTTHLGHAFTYTSADILIRYLEFTGSRVRYVQNVTDIDDDILRRAKEEGVDWKVLGDSWTRHYIHDMIALNVRPPDEFPRATEVITDIIESVEDLLEAGVAYEVAGNVYFAIDRYPRYGALSCLSYAEMLPIANERGNFPDDPKKNDPLDFVLWQAQAPGEPAWESPWGPGRPGWHIECSSMATRFLGKTIDIHGGGADLEFPHHESEIAQIEAIPNRGRFSRFWMHIGMVHYQGDKMSKSLGNLVMVRDLLEDWSADALRLYLGGFHYRQAWEYDPDLLAEMASLAGKLKAAVRRRSTSGPRLDSGQFEREFAACLAQDLDTPGAIRVIERAAGAVMAAKSQGMDLEAAQSSLRRMAAVFGLRLNAKSPDQKVHATWNEHLEKFRSS